MDDTAQDGSQLTVDSSQKAEESALEDQTKPAAQKVTEPEDLQADKSDLADLTSTSNQSAPSNLSDSAKPVPTPMEPTKESKTQAGGQTQQTEISSPPEDEKTATTEITEKKPAADEGPLQSEAGEPRPESQAETKQPSTVKPSESSAPDSVSSVVVRDNSGTKWYVVHTYSGHEAKVANTLKQRIDSLKLSDKILDILIPTQDKIEIKEGKKATVKEKIFPGYLLINMILDDNTWLAVRTTPGITGFIGTSTKPTALPEDEVKTIQRFMSMEAPKFKTTFSQGEAIKITDGPFSEFLGTVSEIDEERGKLKVLVSVFGRETPVELDFLQVAKL